MRRCVMCMEDQEEISLIQVVPMTLAGTSGVSREDAGLASGLLNTAQQVGGSIGLAVLSTLAASRTTSLLHGPVTPGSVLSARVSGFHVAFIAAGVLLVAAWIITLFLRNRSAGLRHHVWAAVILSALALPVFTFLLPTWHSAALGGAAAAFWNPVTSAAPRSGSESLPAMIVNASTAWPFS